MNQCFSSHAGELQSILYGAVNMFCITYAAQATQHGLHRAGLHNVRRRRDRIIEKAMISHRDLTKMKKKTIKITSPNVPQRGSKNPMILIALPKNLISIYSEVSQVTYISPDDIA